MISVVDTYTLTWYLHKDSRLPPKAQTRLMHGSERIVVPSIVLAEMKHIHAKGRIPTSLEDTLTWIARANNGIGSNGSDWVR